MTVRVFNFGDGAGRIETDSMTVIYLNGLPGWAQPLCPYCFCCTWENYGYDEGDGICVGHCNYPEGADHPEVLGPYCPACLDSHHGRVCPNLDTDYRRVFPAGILR